MDPSLFIKYEKYEKSDNCISLSCFEDFSVFNQNGLMFFILHLNNVHSFTRWLVCKILCCVDKLHDE